jgi:4a-hydroxytetrahydrobiopterin dehydratase
MPKAPLLDDAEIGERLATLRGWARTGDRLVKTLRFADFRSAVAFVNSIVAPSDEQNHHPDVSIHWNEVTLSLWTHASGGITERDFRLAATIDQMEELDANP